MFCISFSFRLSYLCCIICLFFSSHCFAFHFSYLAFLFFLSVFLRFPDAGSRVAWQEVFQNTINFANKKSSNSVKKPNHNWLSQSILDLGSLMRRKTALGAGGNSGNHHSHSHSNTNLNNYDGKSRSDEEDNNHNNKDDHSPPAISPSKMLNTTDSSANMNRSNSNVNTPAIITRSRKPPIFTVPHKSQVH
jgi:hypothetical protein